MGQCVWNSGNGAALTCQVADLQLTVVTVGGMPRYLVRHWDRGRQTLVGPPADAALLMSGTGSSVSGAMAAAEAAATRLAAEAQSGNRVAM